MRGIEVSAEQACSTPNTENYSISLWLLLRVWGMTMFKEQRTFPIMHIVLDTFEACECMSSVQLKIHFHLSTTTIPALTSLPLFCLWSALYQFPVLTSVWCVYFYCVQHVWRVPKEAVLQWTMLFLYLDREGTNPPSQGWHPEKDWNHLDQCHSERGSIAEDTIRVWLSVKNDFVLWNPQG